MSRSQRQVEELRALCQCGSLRRAVDLAFQHFADFGRNEEVLDFIADAIEHTPVPAAIRRRFLDLQSSSPKTGQGQVSGRSGAGRSVVLEATNDHTTKGPRNVQ